jgi:hypothetical protein
MMPGVEVRVARVRPEGRKSCFDGTVTSLTSEFLP